MNMNKVSCRVVELANLFFEKLGKKSHEGRVYVFDVHQWVSPGYTFTATCEGFEELVSGKKPELGRFIDESALRLGLGKGRNTDQEGAEMLSFGIWRSSGDYYDVNGVRDGELAFVLTCNLPREKVPEDFRRFPGRIENTIESLLANEEALRDLEQASSLLKKHHVPMSDHLVETIQSTKSAMGAYKGLSSKNWRTKVSGMLEKHHAEAARLLGISARNKKLMDLLAELGNSLDFRSRVMVTIPVGRHSGGPNTHRSYLKFKGED